MIISSGRSAVLAATVAAVACLALTACHAAGGSAGSAGAAAGVPSTAPAAPSASTSASPTASAPATVTPGPTVTPTATAPSSAPATADLPASARPAMRSATATADATCRNLTVSAGVKRAVTQTWANAKRITHVQPRPGAFFYGACGTTLYAAVRFEAAAGATDNDLVQLQDEGSVLQFFRFTPSTGWAFTGSDTHPATNDCSRAVPAALALQWHCA